MTQLYSLEIVTVGTQGKPIACKIQSNLYKNNPETHNTMTVGKIFSQTWHTTHHTMTLGNIFTQTWHNTHKTMTLLRHYSSTKLCD